MTMRSARFTPFWAAALWLALTGAPAGAVCPPGTNPAFTAGGNVFGRIASQWNAYFSAKVDVTNGHLCNPTIEGVLRWSEPYQYAQPVNAATVTMNPGIINLILDPVAELATLTVNLPLAPLDGQVARMGSSNILAGLTVNAGTGATVSGGTAMIVFASGGLGFIYRATNTNWYRMY